MAREKPAAPVEVRVLADCVWGKVNDVVQLGGSDLEGAIALGMVDDHPDAVAYAKTLG